MWDFGVKDAIDILIVASLLYYLYGKLKASGSLGIFQGVVAIIAVWLLVTQVLRMRLLGALLDSVASVLLIGLVVIFQNDIRQFLIRLGSRKQWNFLTRYLGKEESEAGDQWIDSIVLACQHMSEQKVGALIVIQRSNDLSSFIATGDMIDAKVTTRLIEQIFYKNTPLHDGAMIVAGGRIKSAASILPVSHNKRIPQELGLRHRSAIGMSEETDARIVIVSEETGDISLAQNGRITRNLTPAGLQKQLLKS